MVVSFNADKIWYFAYGSNMSSEKFTGRRGIVPLASARVFIPNWVLSMEIPGVPYSEPSYGSIRPRDQLDAEQGAYPDVIGVAYLITTDEYPKVIASEGGQIAYESIAVLGKPVGLEDEEKTGSNVTVRTLGSTPLVRHPTPTPSKRYMDLLIVGAKEAELPLHYQKYLSNLPHYTPPSSLWTKTGAYIFLALVDPIWILLDRITHANTGKDGNVPDRIVWLVRTVVFLVWLLHDHVFAPMFGRGDGLKDEELDGISNGMVQDKSQLVLEKVNGAQ